LSSIIPSQTVLLQNYPNPFNPETWIPFALAEDASVTINIYGTKGNLIRRFDIGKQEAGTYISRDRSLYWDGRNNMGERVSSGIYFYQLQAGKFNAVRRLVIMK
jgi:flagellar hook assembly protein FlgD